MNGGRNDGFIQSVIVLRWTRSELELGSPISVSTSLTDALPASFVSYQIQVMDNLIAFHENDFEQID